MTFLLQLFLFPQEQMIVPAKAGQAGSWSCIDIPVAF